MRDVHFIALETDPKHIYALILFTKVLCMSKHILSQKPCTMSTQTLYSLVSASSSLKTSVKGDVTDLPCVCLGIITYSLGSDPTRTF